MSNGSLVKMVKGSVVRRFWIFLDGYVVEYTSDGRKEVPDFNVLYRILKNQGFEEI